MRIDEPRADRRPRLEPHRGGGLGRQSPTERKPRLDHFGADAGESVVLQRPKPDAVEKFAGPALFMREIREFAGDGADRTLKRAGRPPREVIRQIEEMPGPGEGLGLAPGEPGEFRGLHFRRYPAADIAQRLVAAGIDPIGVGHGAVIHPDDHVAFGRVGQADR